MNFSKVKHFYQVNGENIAKVEINILNENSDQIWKWFTESHYQEFLKCVKPIIDTHWDVVRHSRSASTVIHLTGSSMYIACMLKPAIQSLHSSCLIPKAQHSKSGSYSNAKLIDVVFVAGVCSTSHLTCDVAQSVLEAQIRTNCGRKRSSQQLNIDEFLEKPSTSTSNVIDLEKTKKKSPEISAHPSSNSPIDVEFEESIRLPLKINDKGLIDADIGSTLSMDSHVETEPIESIRGPDKTDLIKCSLFAPSPIAVDDSPELCSDSDNEKSNSFCAVKTLDEICYNSDENCSSPRTVRKINALNEVALCGENSMSEDEFQVRDDTTKSNDNSNSSSFKTVLTEEKLTKSDVDHIYFDDNADFCEDKFSFAPKKFASEKSETSKYFSKSSTKLSACDKFQPVVSKNLEPAEINGKIKKMLDNVLKPSKSCARKTNRKDTAEFQTVNEEQLNDATTKDNEVKQVKSKLVVGPWITMDKGRKKITSTAKRKLTVSPAEKPSPKRKSKLSRKKKPVVKRNVKELFLEDSDEDIFKSSSPSISLPLSTKCSKQSVDNSAKNYNSDDSDLPPAFDDCEYQTTSDDISRTFEQNRKKDNLFLRDIDIQQDESQLPTVFDYCDHQPTPDDICENLRKKEQKINVLLQSIEDQLDDSELPPVFDFTKSQSTSRDISKQCEKETNIIVHKPDIQTEDTEDCVVIEKPESRKESWKILEEIYAKDEVDQLGEEHLHHLLKVNENYFKDIFGGRIQSSRHQKYAKGGVTRVRLLDQVFISLYTDKQVDFVMNFLLGIFCKRDNKYHDYVFKVLLTESLIKLLMDFKRLSHEEAEEMLFNGKFKDINDD